MEIAEDEGAVYLRWLKQGKESGCEAPEGWDKKGGENRKFSPPGVGWYTTKTLGGTAARPARQGHDLTRIVHCGKRLTTKGIAFADFVTPQKGRVNGKKELAHPQFLVAAEWI
jgi:hypothetical protein